MARRAAQVLLLLGLLGTWTTVRGQDNFDLADALDDLGPTKKPSSDPKVKPSPTPRKPIADDPVQPGPPKPKPYPDPNKPGSSGGFSDADLIADGNSGGDGGGGGGGGGGGSGGDQRHNGDGQAESQGVVPGIVGAVVVAVAGAISSFIAYQKKKLCFKENAEQGDLNMENHQRTNAEPPVQQTLLDR